MRVILKLTGCAERVHLLVQEHGQLVGAVAFSFALRVFDSDRVFVLYRIAY